MNASSISTPDLIPDNDIESDTETNPDNTPEYYQPISSTDFDDHDEDSHSDQSNSDEDHHNNYRPSDFHHLDNGHCTLGSENRISSLNLNDDVEEQKSSSDDEEERISEASDSAILRAFREDENRRNAPLTQENATRVMEAMRGVSFGGLVPDWAARVSEEQWIDQLRRLRQPPRNSTSVQN